MKRHGYWATYGPATRFLCNADRDMFRPKQSGDHVCDGGRSLGGLAGSLAWPAVARRSVKCIQLLVTPVHAAAEIESVIGLFEYP